MKLKTIGLLMSTILLTGCVFSGGESNPYPEYENNYYTVLHDIYALGNVVKYSLSTSEPYNTINLHVLFGNNADVIKVSGLTGLSLVSHIQMTSTDSSTILDEEEVVSNFSDESNAYSYKTHIGDISYAFPVSHSIEIPFESFSLGGNFLLEAYLKSTEGAMIPESYSSANIVFESDGTDFWFSEVTQYVFQ